MEEARSYARDYESTDEEMGRLIAYAEEYLDSAIGAGCDKTGARVKMLAGMLVTDADDHRGTNAAEDNSRRWLTTSLLMQLRLEHPP